MAKTKAKPAAKPKSIQFSQTFLKPGRYQVGPDRFRDFTAEDLQLSIAETTRMIADGNAVPVIYEHPSPGSDAGAPRQSKADQVRNGAGWLSKLAQGSDGSASHVLDITDSVAARKVAEGSIKFTSPEIRETFTDGKGRTYRNVFSHFALTHKPRMAGQEPLKQVAGGVEGALQFSLADAVQLSDEDDDENPLKKKNPEDEGDDDAPVVDGASDETPVESPAAEAAPEVEAPNADMPPDANAGDMDKALVANLAELGAVLPDKFDLSSPNAKEVLLTALKTLVKAKQDSGAEKDNTVEGTETVEQSAPMQFSLSDVDDPAFENKLLAKVVKRADADLRGRLESLSSSARISSKVKEDLLTMAGSVQFSADAEEVPGISLSQLVGVLEQLPPGTVLGNVETLDHPGGAQFSAESPAQETLETAKATADWVFGVGKHPQLN